jgi:hypothetical protein
LKTKYSLWFLETGDHSRPILAMLRSSPILEYPKSDWPVSFEGHDVVPLAFHSITEAWNAAG